MDKDLTKQVDEIRDKVDVIADLVNKRITDEDGVANVRTEVGALKAKLETHEKWVSEVEKRLSNARYGIGRTGGSDHLLSVIPERYKAMMDQFERRGRKSYIRHGNRRVTEIDNDPVKSCVLEAWLKNAARLQLGSFSRQHAQCAEENDKIEEALGCNVSEMARMKAAYAEGAGGTGGFVVPSPLEAMVLRVAEDASVVRPLAQVMTMTAFKHYLPADATSISVAVVAEAGAIGQSETTFTQKTIEAKMIAVRGLTSMQVVQDSAIGLLDYWLERASEAYGLFEDNEALEGDTTNFTGLSDDAGVNELLATITVGGVDTNGGPVHYTQLVQAVYLATKRSTRANAVWFMHPDVLRNIIAKEDSNGNPILNRQDVARALSQNIVGLGLGEGTILGYPVYTSDQISITRTKGTLTTASNIYFGPPAQGILLGDLLGLQFGVSEHVAWNNAQLSMRLLKRTGIIIQRPAAMTRYINVDAS